MRIKVNKVSDGWLSRPGADPLFTLYCDGMGEPIRTYDKELAMMGIHDAEEYVKKGNPEKGYKDKHYWRLVKNAPKKETVINNSASFNEGAAYGVALHAASRLVASLSKNTMVSIQDLQEQTLNVAQYLFENRPDAPKKEAAYPHREGDTKDLPPVELYDENPVNLDEIPF